MNAFTLSKTGWFTATLQSLSADDQASAFAAATLSDRNIHHKALLDAVKAAAPVRGYGAPLLGLLDYLFDFVREIDWKDGRPICFASNERIALDLRQTVSAIKKKLRRLADLGLISRSGDSNGKRIGGRLSSGPRKGHLRDDTAGINLAPLAALYQDHTDAADQYRALCAHVSQLARDARRQARQIRQLGDQCEAMGLPPAQWRSHADQADLLNRQIESRKMAIDAPALQAITDEITTCRAALAAIVRSTLLASSSENSPQGGKKSPQIPSTTPITFPEGVKASQSGSSGNGNSQTETVTREETHEVTYTEHGQIKATELFHLFPAFSEFLPDARKMRSWEDLSNLICDRGLGLIDLKREKWGEVMGQLPLGYPAMMYAIALQWLIDNPEKARAKRGAGGGYFIGMERKYDDGELNLHATIMKRRKMLDQ